MDLPENKKNGEDDDSYLFSEENSKLGFGDGGFLLEQAAEIDIP